MCGRPRAVRGSLSPSDAVQVKASQGGLFVTAPLGGYCVESPKDGAGFPPLVARGAPADAIGYIALQVVASWTGVLGRHPIWGRPSGFLSIWLTAPWGTVAPCTRLGTALSSL